MSAILLGQKILENPFLIEEETKKRDSPKDDKDQIIEGKNKTYIISKTLGKGTFGKVKLAYNKDNKNEKYACKILLKSNIKDEDDYKRCKREMDILKKMHHVNVVRTYEIISTETTYYIFMDFCAKGELFNYIVEKQHLSQEKSAFFYYQLINGIEYIHKKGVCHRDLKPENLLLTEKNKLKIIDFGLSNYFKGNLLETPCGSPCYASPEMVMGNQYNGFCIDIWSSGIILYAMLCGYLPFEEMENDEYNEVLFRNIVECNVDYPDEFITPVAKDLLCKILVKDPRKRITIDEIKLHNFYLLGELLYKQTFENKGNINDMLFMNEDEKYIDIDDLSDSGINNIVSEKNKNNINSEEKLLTNKDNLENGKNLNIEEEKVNFEKKILEDKNNFPKDTEFKENDEKLEIQEKNNFTPLNSEKKEKNKEYKSNEQNKTEKNNESINRNILGKIKQIIKDENNNNKNSLKKKEKQQNKNINNNKNKENINKNSNKKAKSKDLLKPKDDIKKQSIKQLSLETYHNIQLPSSNNEKNYKGNILQNSLNIKKSKTNKDEKSQKEYSVQEDYSNNNKNSNEINFKNQYLKTEICPSNLKNKSKNKKGHYQCKLLNKKLVNNNKIAFDNILKSLQNKNTFKNKTPKRYSTKKNIPVKQNSNQSNSITKKKYCSYSPGIRKISKNGKNINNNLDKNMIFPRQNNYPLTTHNNIKNSYNLLHENFLKYLNTKFFFNNNINTENIKKISKPNKRFNQKKNNKNNINSINNDNYFRNNNNINTKNNGDKKLFKNSVNNALNIKSFEYCLSSNTSKKKHLIVEKKLSNNDTNAKKNNNILLNNFNISKNQKNNISKKSFSNLKGNNYVNNIFSDNSKPILINSSHIRKNTETIKNKKNKSLNYKNNNKLKNNSNKNSKSKSKSKKSNLLLHKSHNIYNKDNIDNNIIINFNILKPNIILDHQRTSSRKTKINKFGLTSNITQHNNIMPSRFERPITESNFCSTVRNNFFNRSNKNKNFNNNYKNIDLKQIKQSKELNQIIKSIQEVKKIQGNIKNINNNKKRMNTEI